MKKLFVRFPAILALAVWSIGSAAPAQAQIARFTKVHPSLYRGGQPEQRLDYDRLKKAGVRTIINLQSDEDWIEQDQANARRLGMGFRSYPLNPLGYPEERVINLILSDLVNPRLMPVFIHCQHGKDRTGLLVGLYRVFVDHWDSQHAYDEMRDIGFNPILFGLDLYYWNHVKGH